MEQNSQNRRFRFSLTACILAVFFVLLTPMLAIQIYNYSWNAAKVEQKLNSTVVSNVRHMADSFEQELNGLVYQMNQLLNSNDTVRYLIYQGSQSPSEQYAMESSVLLQMKNTFYSNRMIGRLRLIYPGLHTAFQISSTHQHNDNPSQSGVAVSEEEISQLLEACGNRLFQILMMDNQLVLIYCRSSGGSTPWVICEIVISEEQLVRLLQGYEDDSRNKAFLLLDGYGVIFSAVDDMNAIYPQLAANEQCESFSVQQDGKSYVAFSSSVPKYHFTFVQLVDREIIKAIPNRLILLLMITGGVAILCIVLYSLFLNSFLNRPLRRMLDCFQKVGNGDLAIRADGFTAKELDNMASGFNHMTDHLKRLIDENYRQTILLQNAKLHQYQSQIKPHFLYNSFFMLRGAVEADDQDKAEKICTCLGNYFRFLTRLNKESLLLQDEVENTENYIAIQKMRFSGHLEIISQSLPEIAKTLRVPALILQPLIENAIDYGMTSSKTIIRISYELTETALWIRVEDSGTRFTSEVLSSMTDQLNAVDAECHAIGNIHHRLQLFYGDTAKLMFAKSELGGCCAILVIPTVHQVHEATPETPEQEEEAGAQA